MTYHLENLSCTYNQKSTSIRRNMKPRRFSLKAKTVLKSRCSSYTKRIELNGKNPTYLYAYGGFNISLRPTFSTQRIVWLENGGIYAQPNLRGGGEYGEKWHKAGTKMQKQNVFDDFIAAGEWLIDNNYTTSEYLAIAGGSNGGLLVGATMTQRPDLAKVAFPAVGVMDMLRYHKLPREQAGQRIMELRKTLRKCFSI